MDMKSDKSAVSPILGTIFILTIVTLVASSLLYWGVPTIQKLQYESQYFSTKNYFEIIDNAMDEVIREGNGSSRGVSVLINNGQLLAEKFTERWLIYYDLLPDQNITYWGFGENNTNGTDGDCTIITNLTRINLTVSWIDKKGVAYMISRSNIFVQNNIYNFSSNIPLTGVDPSGNPRFVKIEVYNYSSGQKASEFYLFDIGSIKFDMPSPIGYYSIKEINSAVITDSPGGTYVQNSPYVIERDGKSLALGIIQLNTSGSGSGSLKIKMKNEHVKIEQNSYVYNLRVKILSTERDAFVYSWYNFFTNYGLSVEGFQNDGDLLLYKNNNQNKVDFKLIHNIIRVEVGR